MIGILTEKPSAARNFAKALFAKKNGQNFKGNFEGNDIIIVHSYGHLYGLVYPRYQVPKEKELRYASWNIQYLPWDDNDICWKKAPLPKTKEAIENIKTTLENCSEIVIATDNDPSGEGDLLAGEILLGTHLDAKKLSRMYFADESVKSIQKAFLNRKTIPKLQDNPEFKKGLYRERLDFLSMQHTRIATYYSGCNAVLRQGRLKSVMNNLVGKQFEAIDAYKKIPYYQNRFKDENGNVYINAEEEMYPNKNDVPAIYTTSSVIIDEKQIKHTAPPRLLDLAGLSSALSKKFGANTVLRTYQKMYEKQIVSYPRTEDKYISPEQFKELLPDIDKIAILVGVDSSLLTHRQPRKTHVKAGGAHGANRPGTNSCPCGYYPMDKCRCTYRQIVKYQNRISGPILDRIDLFVRCEEIGYEALTSNSKEESSADIRKRVSKAWEIQKERFAQSTTLFNGRMNKNEVEIYCKLDEEGQQLMKEAFSVFQLTGRSYFKILKVARTIADLEGSYDIKSRHVEEALYFRQKGEGRVKVR